MINKVERFQENKKYRVKKDWKEVVVIDYDTAEALRELALERYLRIAEEVDRLLESEESTKKLQL